MRATLTSLLLAGALAVGCGPGEAPANPTWADDVEPILRGNCLGCHGASAGPLGRERLDVYAPDSYQPALANSKTGIMGAGPLAETIVNYVTSPDANIRMPPPPASALTDHDITVLERWAQKKPPLVGTRLNNHPPVAESLAGPTWMGNDLAVPLLVTDDDGDAVLGSISVGTAKPSLVLRAGTQTVLVDSTGIAPGMPISLRVSDGWQTFEFSLGVVPPR